MRQVLISFAVAVGGLAVSVAPVRAGPFCLATDLYGGPPDCHYDTWAQCRKAQPGVGLYCYTNTAAGYVFDTRDPGHPRVIGREPPRKFRTRHY
jgi:Protein of unknown function (DUF3551)